MSGNALFYPVLAQTCLTFVLLQMTGRSRLAALKHGEVKIEDIALGQPAWPARPTQFVNTYNSQFQLPVLFYVAIVFAFVLGVTDIWMVLLAWAFVATRVIHAGIYTTTNNIRHRFIAFVAGFVVLASLWVYLALISLTMGN